MPNEQVPKWPVDENRNKIEIRIRLLNYLISEAETSRINMLKAISSLELSLTDTPDLLEVGAKNFEKPLALKQPLQTAIEKIKLELNNINQIVENYKKEKYRLEAELNKPLVIN